MIYRSAQGVIWHICDQYIGHLSQVVNRRMPALYSSRYILNPPKICLINPDQDIQ